jgi:hypothetical protein
VIAQAMDRFDAQVLAYCLMGNHDDLVLHTREANLSRLMRASERRVHAGLQPPVWAGGPSAAGALQGDGWSTSATRPGSAPARR